MDAGIGRPRHGLVRRRFGGSLAVYSGSALNSLTRLASDYDGTSLTASFTAAAGQTYHVQVGSYFDPPGAFTLDWSIVPLVPSTTS